MTVRVRLFAGLKYIVGDRDVELTLPAGATVDTLRHRLTEEYPALEAFMTTYVCAIDEEVQPPERVLSDGELVDLIPPIAGG
jgi:molybdopterin converting factor small subunit